jgi:hypothetical protein
MRYLIAALLLLLASGWADPVWAQSAEWTEAYNRHISFLRHPRHGNGLHPRQYLIAVSGLDYPFMGLAAFNIDPQHLYLRRR